MEGLRKIEFGNEVKLVEVDQVQGYLNAGWKLSAVETKKRLRKAQHKKWKLEHKDEVRESKRQYIKDHPEKNRERVARYFSKEENRQKQRERTKKYYQEHKEQLKLYYQEYNKKHKKS